jgi:hypothetical protein
MTRRTRGDSRIGCSTRDQRLEKRELAGHARTADGLGCCQRRTMKTNRNSSMQVVCADRKADDRAELQWVSRLEGDVGRPEQASD